MNAPILPETPRFEPDPARPRIADIMAIVAGLAFSFWLFGHSGDPDSMNRVLITACMILGGLSVMGPILLLSERWRQRKHLQRRRPWGPGRILWFSTGAAAWLTWPPLVQERLGAGGPKAVGDNGLAICTYIYGTPLMAIYVTSALLFGGWLPFGRRRGRRRRPLPWRERFGLLLGLAWACTGMWVLYLMYFRSRG